MREVEETPVVESEAQPVLQRLLEQLLGAERAETLLRVVTIHPPLLQEAGQQASRAVLAQALNLLLFEDLVNRVPVAARYLERALQQGRTILHDHGAVRTVALQPMGALPAGQDAIVRLLAPLGYALHGVYPLERLRMTGRSYAHVDLPEEIAQFFISELHPERFSPHFGEVVARVTATSVDPLSPEALELLQTVEQQRWLPVEDAVRLLPMLASCFARHHGEVFDEDYEALLAESAEMAWIATEGNVFNHVTDRVADVDALADEQRALGEPIKETVERSHTGRVRQTAFLAARVQRQFRTPDGGVRDREVPGSFLELITRLPLPEEQGGLDLGFDSSNAQAIFKMTASS